VIARLIACAWIMLAALALLYLVYEHVHPCGTQALREDAGAWALRGCKIEYSPRITWHNLFERKPVEWKVETWPSTEVLTIDDSHQDQVIRINRTGKRIDTIEVWPPPGVPVIVHEEPQQ
jgi:hypothetical protein